MLRFPSSLQIHPQQLSTIALLLAFAILPGDRAMAVSAGQEAASEVRIDRIDIGIDGHFKVGCRTPISVTFTGTVADPLQLAVWVPDPDGNLNKQPSDPVMLSGDGPHQVTSIFRTGRMDGVIRVELETAGRVLAAKTVRSTLEQNVETAPLFPPDSLSANYWITLDAGSGYSRAAEEINQESSASQQRGREAVTVIALSDAALIPTQPGGLDSVDVLAINGAHPLTSATNAAIRAWVEQGGHLILSISSQEQWEQMPLSAWVPIRDVGNSRLRELDELRGQFPRTKPFDPGTVKALRFSIDAGETLASALDGPLWVRLPVQFGRVTLLGLDLNARPLVTWDGLAPLCERLTDYQRDSGSRRKSQQTAQLSRTGVSDLSTQLATAIDQFPQFHSLSSWMPMGLIVLYLLVIGPLDYLIVHRVLRRPHLTWLTFPLLVVASAALAASTARENHPADLVLRQASLIDLDAASGALRTTLWSSFVSPETRRYRVQADFGNWWQRTGEATGGPQDSVTQLGWTGIPENSFRGMYRAGGLDLPKPRYHFTPGLTSIDDLPVGIWSSSSTTAVHFEHVADPGQISNSNLEGVGRDLYGTITNRLPLPIDDWFIVYGSLVYFPRPSENGTGSVPLRSGQTISVRQSGMVVRTARSYLTGVKNLRIKKGAGKTDESDAATRDAYDPHSRDFERIFRAISFYRASGGKEFTTLDNDAIERLDLSPFLDLSRAVLFGRIAISPAQLNIDDHPVEPADSEAFIRVLLPVRARK